MKVKSLKRMGAGGVAGRVDSMTANTVVRKLGHVLGTAARVMAENLRSQEDGEAQAERLLTLLLPLVEALVHFDVDAREGEENDDDGV